MAHHNRENQSKRKSVAVSFEEACKLQEQKKFKLAHDAYEILCEMGDASACTNLATMYSHGEGVELNFDKAIALELKAINLGSKTALSNLAITYRMKGDCREARLWFEKAIEAGEGDALLDLARLLDASDYERGRVKELLSAALTHEQITENSRELAEQMLEKIKAG
jgi:uncharacterized protein